MYEAMPGKLPDLNARFRNHTLKLFEKHGMTNVGYWTANVGDYSNRLIYILGFEDVAQRESAWNGFRNDPEWQAVVAEYRQAIGVDQHAGGVEMQAPGPRITNAVGGFDVEESSAAKGDIEGISGVPYRTVGKIANDAGVLHEGDGLVVSDIYQILDEQQALVLEAVRAGVGNIVGNHTPSSSKASRSN